MKNSMRLGLVVAVASLLFAGPAAANGYGEEGEVGGGPTEEEVEREYEETEEQIEREGEEVERDVEREMREEEEEIGGGPTEEAEPMAEPEDIDEPYEEPEPLVAEEEPGLLTPMGIGITVGGGVLGFTDGDFNDFVDTGGGWEGRVAVGTRTLLGFEAAYVGTANDIDTFGVEDDAILLSNGAEAALRLNLATTPLKPYILAGAGWKHYEVENTDVNTSNLQDADDVFEFPLGAGLNYSYRRFIADVRGTFRPAVDSEMLRSDIANEENELHTWKAGANVGFEF